MDPLALIQQQQVAAHLATFGTECVRASGQTFRAFVPPSRSTATFNLATGMDEAAEAEALCFRSDAPAEGEKVTVDGTSYLVTSLQTRPGSPLARVTLSILPANGAELEA